MSFLTQKIIAEKPHFRNNLVVTRKKNPDLTLLVPIFNGVKTGISLLSHAQLASIQRLQRTIRLPTGLPVPN